MQRSSVYAYFGWQQDRREQTARGQETFSEVWFKNRVAFKLDEHDKVDEEEATIGR